MAEETKRCPHCHEEMNVTAITCKHCGAPLDEPIASSYAHSRGPLANASAIPREIKLILGERYEFSQELGGGEMGVVYKAHDKRLEIDVAIKLLPAYLARDNQGVEDLKQEAIASMTLRHPNIVRLYHFVDHPAGKLLITEFIEGKTLDQILDESSNHRLSEEQVIRYAIEACKGIEYAHQQGVMHCDVTPSNIVVSSQGDVKIADFGIDRVLKDSHARHSGAIMSGTLLYMSPEQITEKTCDARGDVYALGISLYELLSGEVPFASGNIAAQHREAVPPPIEGVSKTLNAIVLKCLAKRPADRFQSAKQLMEALEGKPIELINPSLMRSKSAFLSKWWRNSPSAAAILVALLVAIGLSAGVIGYVRHIRIQKAGERPKSQPSLLTPERAANDKVAPIPSKSGQPPQQEKAGTQAAKVTKGVSQGSRMFVVAADGSGQYTRIQAAVDAARSGDTVMVKPATYRERISFKNGLRLQGSEGGGCRIEPVGGATAMMSVNGCTSGTIENLVLDASRSAAQDSQLNGIALVNSKVEVRNCTVQGLNGTGIIVSEGSKPIIVNNRCRANELGGIRFERNAGGTAEGNICENNGDSGIVVLNQGTSPTIRNNQCRGNGADGITFAEGAKGTAEGNVCENNTSSGISVAGPETGPIIKDNQCLGNEFHGIHFRNGAGGTAESNVCENNEQQGIFVIGQGTSLMLSKNQCRGNKASGVTFADGAKAAAEVNVCENNENSGITVAGQATSAAVKNNQCRGNKQHGISFWNGAGGIAENNMCENNEWQGILAAGRGTNPILNKNQCRGNEAYGIDFGEGASGTAESNVCENNKFAGIIVAGQDTSPTVKNNQCRRNEQHGICFWNGAVGVAENNVCENNKWQGILVIGQGTNPILSKNQCRGNEACGIDFAEGASGTAESNVCENNKFAGIFATGKYTSPTVKNNRSQGNKLSGISFRDRAGGIADGNACENNEDSGINVADAYTSPTVKNNQCRKNEQHGICFWNGAGGTAENNVCENNKRQGILVIGQGTSPILNKNQCRGNEVCGIDFEEGASGTAESNVCENNKSAGIAVAGQDTSPTLTNNQCRGNRYWQVYFDGGAIGENIR